MQPKALQKWWAFCLVGTLPPRYMTNQSAGSSQHPIPSGIYIIQNTVNAKRYVGSSANIQKRWSEHSNYLRNNRHCNPHLQAAWNKYGEDAFKLIVFDPVEDITELIEHEQWWINNLRPEYNILKVAGSPRGRKASLQTRAKLSAALKGNTRREGKKASPESRAKLSAARLGKKKTPEHKAKLSAASLGRKHSQETLAKMSAARLGKSATWNIGNTWNAGKKLTPEHRAKLSAAKLGKKLTPEHKAKLSEALKGNTNHVDWKRKRDASAYTEGIVNPSSLSQQLTVSSSVSSAG